MIKNIIAFVGAHGTGKTTAAYEMAAKLKKEGRNVGIITEMARKCPFPIVSVKNGASSMDAQIWIWSRQLLEEAEASTKYDVVISDRSLIDCIAYTRYSNHFALATMYEYMLPHVARYQKIVFKAIANNPYCHDDGLRSMDLICRNQIETEIQRTLTWNRMNYEIQ